MNIKYIHQANGFYFGFISNESLFSRDGAYLGWVENDSSVWDKHGRYRGHIITINNANYIFRPRFTVSPIPKVPKVEPVRPVLPQPAMNLMPIIIPLSHEEAFKNPNIS
ncbi:MAG: 4-fold beta flower protein [Patescibacteria group bacterium]